MTEDEKKKLLLALISPLKAGETRPLSSAADHLAGLGDPICNAVASALRNDENSLFRLEPVERQGRRQDPTLSKRKEEARNLVARLTSRPIHRPDADRILRLSSTFRLRILVNKALMTFMFYDGKMLLAEVPRGDTLLLPEIRAIVSSALNVSSSTLKNWVGPLGRAHRRKRQLTRHHYLSNRARFRG